MFNLKEVLEEIKMSKNCGETVKEDLIKESVTIKKSDLEKLGKELIKEVNTFLHNDYIITFPEMKLDQEEFDRILNKFKIESLNLEDIYYILARIKLDDEIDGDLYYKKESFKDLFKVLCYSYSYLED